MNRVSFWPVASFTQNSISALNAKEYSFRAIRQPEAINCVSFICAALSVLVVMFIPFQG